MHGFILGGNSMADLRAYLLLVLGIVLYAVLLSTSNAAVQGYNTTDTLVVVSGN